MIFPALYGTLIKNSVLMTVELAKPVDFHKALPDFESRFPMEMAILKLGGVYPREQNEGTVNPYTGELDTEYFGNIGEHSLAVALCAEIITDNVLGETHPQKRNIVARALIHDSTKRFEIMRRKAVKAGAIDDAYSYKAYDTIKPLLEERGMAPDIIAYMAIAGSETGHNSFVDFVAMRDGAPTLKTEGNLAEMIVHHADDMTYTPIVKAGEAADTYFLTAPERMEASNFPERYPFLYKEGFGFDEAGSPVFIKDISQDHAGVSHVKTYADWQVWIAAKIADHLVNLMSPKNPVEDAQLYIKQLVNSALQQESQDTAPQS